MAIESLIGSTPLFGPIKDGQFSKTKLDRWNFVKRGGALRNEAMLWYPAWKDLSKYLNPTRGFFYTERPNVGKEIDHKTIIDTTPEDSINTLASGMSSGLTSPSRPWFRLSLPNPELMDLEPVKIWLEEVQRRMFSVFSKSNLYGALYSMYEEIATFGTACCFLQEDFNDVIRLRVYTAGEYYLGCGADGRVNSFYHRFWMTVGQVVEEFGLENCSAQTQMAFRNNTPDLWVLVNHLIEENDERVPFLKDYKNMAYRSVYWEDGAMMDSYLRLGGYEEFPLLTPRWSTTTTADSYGKGPGWKMLGDGKMLQKLQKKGLIGIEKMVDPPLQVDASVQGEVNTLPGGVTRFSAQMPNAGVKAAYQVALDINALEVKIQRVQDSIKRKSFADLFLMLVNAERTGNPLTATEVMERQSEKLSILGPVLERLEGELLDPLIERTFMIMVRKGLIPLPPKEIADMELKVQYISILAQAQKMTNITAIDQWQQGVGMTAQLTGPEALDVINADEISTEKAEMLGVPAKCVNSPEVIAKKRKDRDDANAQAAKAQQGMMMAEAAAKGGKGVKDLAAAPLGENSALDAIMNGVSGAQ